MTIQTKYDPGDGNPKIIESTISFIGINAALSGTTTTYYCLIDRENTNTIIRGTPRYYVTERSGDGVFATMSNLPKCAPMVNCSGLN